MEIFMLTQTSYKGKTVRPGDKVDIDDKTAARWIKNKLAIQILAVEEGDKDGDILGVCDINTVSGVSGDSSEKPASRRRKAPKKSK